MEYNKIIAYPGPVPANCAKNLVETLARAQEGWGAFFFSPVFDEFMAHAEHRDVQATIVLLNRLLDGYVSGGEYLNREGWVWSTPYRRFNDNFGKYAIKLFLAVLGNPELRKRVFNF